MLGFEGRPRSGVWSLLFEMRNVFWTREFGLEHIVCDAEQGTDHGNG